jgi:amidase
MAGYPSVTVPFGPLAPLPTGFLFYGRAWSEAKLLALAADFETRTLARREPQFLPTVSTP